MSSRWLVLALSAALAGCDSNVPCDVESLLDHELGGVADRDCGTLALSDDDATFLAARECVVQAFDDAAEFQVIWDVQGIDSRVRRAYYGDRIEGVHRLQFDSGEDGTPSAYARACTVFAMPTEPCEGTLLRDDLCYDCSASSDRTAFCRR